MQSVPSETTLRRYLAKCAEDNFQETKSNCEENAVYLVVDETTDIKNHQMMNVLVAPLVFTAVMAASTKTPARERLLDCLKDAETFVLLPVPVITCLGTWLKAGKYHCINFSAVKHWIDLGDGEGSAAVTNLKRLVENKELVLQLRAISKISDGLCSQIQVFESDNQDATKIWLLLSSVLQMVQSSGAMCKKLTGYMNEHHPALNFWKFRN
ncbi:hypothetical protein ANN_22551 [Periplaneta americana]|uniref:Uncharacterized protein n=1 Tax=Periplaneta americana TaxID=6978 RepID=A0ABQ8S9D6_PERAM|nr:hypothetical protein ANN_22551 [Periplaneta americana]